MRRLFCLGALAVLGTVVRPERSTALPVADAAVPAPRDIKCEAGLAILSENDVTLSDLDVDVVAKPKRNNAEPKFPTNLRGTPTLDASYRDLVSGEVIARFVVDTLGCVDMRTFTVVSASDSAFTEEVARVMPKYRYDPAKKDGRKVRAWLTWKFVFYKEQGVRKPFDR